METSTMSRKELPRPGLLAAAVAGRITNREGARALHVTPLLEALNVLCDLGSSARVLGNNVLATGGPSGHRFHVFMSHLHWDHIMGFPFFMPAYLPGNHVRIYGCHDALEQAFPRNTATPSFPVKCSQTNATD